MGESQDVSLEVIDVGEKRSKKKVEPLEEPSKPGLLYRILREPFYAVAGGLSAPLQYKLEEKLGKEYFDAREATRINYKAWAFWNMAGIITVGMVDPQVQGAWMIFYCGMLIANVLRAGVKESEGVVGDFVLGPLSRLYMIGKRAVSSVREVWNSHKDNLVERAEEAVEWRIHNNSAMRVYEYGI